MENNFKAILEKLQETLNFKVTTEELETTPKRISKMFQNELLIGYTKNPAEILSKTFKTKNEDMVIVKNISFVSLCAHHWLPFMGKAHFGYIPKDGIIVGLSKIPRLVECFARRFQVQENMTKEIADSFYDTVKPHGCIIVTEAEHMCAQIRGVQSYGTIMMCSALRGNFDKAEIKDEFLRLINGKY